MNQCREIAIAIQRKTRLKVRVQPGQDRISVKSRAGVWKDYTAAEAAKAYSLKAYLKPGSPLAEPVTVDLGTTTDPDVASTESTPTTTKPPKTRKPRVKKDK